MKPAIAYTWGSTAAERQMELPCDRYVSQTDDVYFRAINVKASVETLFRWLCQLKVASYSYDWIDQLERWFFKVQTSDYGPLSPQRLTLGTEHLAPGQRMMDIFELVEFEQNRHLTIVMDSPRAIAIFGEVAASYVIFPITENTCRLFLKGHVRYPRNKFWAWCMPWFLPWGDLLMMHKQFVTLKQLAESQTIHSCQKT